MKLHENCLSCIVNQAVRVAGMTHAENREALYHKVFSILAQTDFSLTAPEVCGKIYSVVKAHVGQEDPYQNIRKSCNALMLHLLPELRQQIAASANPLEAAVKYAILGNIIDFSAPGELTDESILRTFAQGENLALTINHVPALKAACEQAHSLLYLGDNCGEIAADRLLLEELHRQFPHLILTYAVRGAAVVNDVVYSDAEDCGIGELARVIDNGDDSQGTVLTRVSEAFLQEYHSADVIIAKGQANYENLSEAPESRIFCLMMTKCAHIAQTVGVPPRALVATKLQ